MKAIGIDIGTTTISAVVLDTEQKCVITAKTISNGSFIKTEQEWERIQDSAVIIRKAKEVLDELLDRYQDVGSIGLTGQMHGILYVNKEGQSLSPLYIWQDGRGNLPAEDDCRETLAARATRLSGMNVSTGYGLVTHLYNVRHGLVPEGSASVCTIGDYLGMVLTGRKTPLVHISNAASMGFFDAKQSRFCKEKLELLGMGSEILPEVTDEFSVLGTYRNIPVTAAVGDNQASFLGSVGIQDNVLLVNMGTGGQISVLSDTFFEVPGIEARPFVKGKYLLAGSSLCGGRAYAILEKFFRSYALASGTKEESQYAVMEKLAKKGAGQQSGLKVSTLFNGTRVNPDLRGSITGLDEDNFTPEAVTYGVLQGMAQELYDMFCGIRNGLGIEAKHLVASGNGLRKNVVLRDIFSQMFQADLTMAEYEEEAACGAAISSAIGAGKN